MKTKIDFTLVCNPDEGYWTIMWNQKLIATVNNIHGIKQAKIRATLGARFLTRLQRQ